MEQFAIKRKGGKIYRPFLFFSIITFYTNNLYNTYKFETSSQTKEKRWLVIMLIFSIKIT